MRRTQNGGWSAIVDGRRTSSGSPPAASSSCTSALLIVASSTSSRCRSRDTSTAYKPPQQRCFEGRENSTSVAISCLGLASLVSGAKWIACRGCHTADMLCNGGNGMPAVHLQRVSCSCTLYRLEHALHLMRCSLGTVRFYLLAQLGALR